MIKWLLKRLLLMVGLLVGLGILGAAGVVALFYHYGRDLPDYHQLAIYEPATETRVHAGDGRLIAEYATERRVFVPIEAIPARVVKAFIAAEDKNFYTHPGVDLLSVLRAGLQNAVHLGQNRRPVGASTITQQVAKNFLLTNEVSLSRKIKEAILAFRIERAFTKEHILELYLNGIYLGGGSYGVAAAALNYFDKSLDQLSIAECAYLAALPKAPNNYNPARFPDQAKARRDYVIERMAEDGYITDQQATDAKNEPLVIKGHVESEFANAGYFSEEVRRELVDRFGEKALYAGGLSVHSTVDPKLQAYADQALREGLLAYDRRHGWRGALGQIPLVAGAPDDAWVARLADFQRPVGIGKWQLALVLGTDDGGATIGLGHGQKLDAKDVLKGRIPFEELKWARPELEEQRVGAVPRKPSDVLAPGDVVLVEPVEKNVDGKPYPTASYGLRQIPEISGAVVVMDPHTGRVLALTGGYQFERTRDEFDRAVQAKRQPGSAFKPFVYLTAVNNGYTPSTMVLDAPFVFDQGPGLGLWKPGNYEKKFYGPSPLFVGLEHSRNLMTVRVAQNIGMEKVAETAERFGVIDHLQRTLAMALGAGETTLLRLTTAYSELDNGGKKITPTLIDWVQDRHGTLIYRHDTRACEGCANVSWSDQAVPELPDTREQLDDPRSIYQVVAMMQGVIERGTGVRARVIGKPLAGKTGTTDEDKDTWFIGFTPDLVCGVYIGFDQPRTQGPDEQGASVALPVFIQFMQKALKDEPAIPFRIPPGLNMVRVRESDGLPAQSGDRNVIWEPFKPGTVPQARGPVIDGSGVDTSGSPESSPAAPTSTSEGTGGIY
ncbi:MAG TPA: penicillin-binding protein 1A [Alphaproteobacteria bacterium]|nr:penicillin-binding protein 1A [Alphaproteobacteria bacterium]